MGTKDKKKKKRTNQTRQVGSDVIATAKRDACWVCYARQPQSESIVSWGIYNIVFFQLLKQFHVGPNSLQTPVM
jgi:hypothetical protein